MNLNAINVNFYGSNLNHKATNNNIRAVAFTGHELITLERQKIMGEIQAEIESANKIAIFTHTNPDGDAAGSAAALKNLIKTKYPKKQVDVFIVNSIPKGFNILEDTKSFNYINEKTNIDGLKKRNYDLAISVDCAVSGMMGKAERIYTSIPRKVKIDHHPSEGESFSDIDLTCEEASSATQVILMLANFMKVGLTPNMASDIYMGLVTDTGGFRFMKKPADVFEDCSELTKTPFDTKKVYCSSMDYMTLDAFKLYSNILNRIKFAEGGQLAYVVDDDTLDKHMVQKPDVKNIFDKIVGTTMVNIEGVKIAAKLGDGEDQVSGSLRGNGVKVNTLAEQMGGGGHE